MSADVRTPAGRAALLAVCEAPEATPRPWWDDNHYGEVAAGTEEDSTRVLVALNDADRALVIAAVTALPEAIEYIERLEREVAGHAHHESKLGRMLGEVTSERDRAVNAHTVVTESMFGWQRRCAELEHGLVVARVALSGEPAPATVNGEPGSIGFVSPAAAVARIDTLLGKDGGQ